MNEIVILFGILGGMWALSTAINAGTQRISNSVDGLAKVAEQQIAEQRKLAWELREFGHALEKWRRHSMGEPEPKGLGDLLSEAMVQNSKQTPDPSRE